MVQKIITQPLGTKNVLNIQILLTNKIQEIGTDHLGLVLRECSPPQMCHVSHVTCHVSHVTCHMSQFYLIFFFFGQSGEDYWWRVCNQRGLPRLVLSSLVGDAGDKEMYFCVRIQQPSHVNKLALKFM